MQRRRIEATPAEKIAQLEKSRGLLIAKRIGLEMKVAELEARQAKERKLKGTADMEGR